MSINKLDLLLLIEGLINEGSSDILYHFTSVNNILNIISTNEISLTSAVGSNADLSINSGKFFFLSMTRSRSSGYRRGGGKIVFDARALKQRYKIAPVDYWQYSKKRSDYEYDSDYKYAISKSEQEDRLVSDKPIIKDAIKYIKEVHVLDGEIINELKELCDLHKIPIYIYSNEKDWLNQMHAKSYSSYIKDNDSDDEYKYQRQFGYGLASFISYNDKESYEEIVNYLNDKNKIAKLDNEIEKNTRNYYKINAHYDYDGKYLVSNWVHDIRGNADSDSRFLLGLLARSMRKFKATNLVDYLHKKQYYGIKPIEEYSKELYQYISNISESTLMNELEYYFNDWIEISGEYYNHAYESDELLAGIYKYWREILKFIKDGITSNGIEFYKIYYRYLDRDILGKVINYDNLKISDGLDITDMSFRYEGGELDKRVKEIFFKVMGDISIYGENRADELYKKYNDQLKG